MSNPHAQRVLITGAASGIALAIARKVHSLGTIVVICDTAVAGLNQLSLSLAASLAPHGIRVNAILPGVIETDTVQAMLTTPAAMAEMAAKQARIPMGRLGTPEEIAELAAFLLSPASSYSTGG